jgi:hypothetical protein
MSPELTGLVWMLIGAQREESLKGRARGRRERRRG